MDCPTFVAVMLQKCGNYNNQAIVADEDDLQNHTPTFCCGKTTNHFISGDTFTGGYLPVLPEDRIPLVVLLVRIDVVQIHYKKLQYRYDTNIPYSVPNKINCAPLFGNGQFCNTEMCGQVCYFKKSLNVRKTKKSCGKIGKETAALMVYDTQESMNTKCRQFFHSFDRPTDIVNRVDAPNVRRDVYILIFDSSYERLVNELKNSLEHYNSMLIDLNCEELFLIMPHLCETTKSFSIGQTNATIDLCTSVTHLNYRALTWTVNSGDPLIAIEDKIWYFGLFQLKGANLHSGAEGGPNGKLQETLYNYRAIGFILLGLQHFYCHQETMRQSEQYITLSKHIHLLNEIMGFKKEETRYSLEQNSFTQISASSVTPVVTTTPTSTTVSHSVPLTLTTSVTTTSTSARNSTTTASSTTPRSVASSSDSSVIAAPPPSAPAAEPSGAAGQSSAAVLTTTVTQTAAGNTVKGSASGPTYSELGIVTERPKRFEYALLPKRVETFGSWPRDHHLRPKELAEAGFYYAGYGDCARCFYCGGGLRNWEDEDDVWVEHARWFPKCAYIRQLMGQVFVDVVQDLNKTNDQISFKMVTDKIGTAASAFQLDSKDNPLKRDPAVKTVVGMGFPIKEVIAVAENIKEDGNILSADKIYEKLMDGDIKRSQTGAKRSGMDTDGANVTRDLEKLRNLKEQNNQLRQQTVCKICMDKEVAVVFLPCGHFVSCTDCAAAMKDCPVCRNHVKGIVRAFMG